MYYYTINLLLNLNEGYDTLIVNFCNYSEGIREECDMKKRQRLVTCLLAGTMAGIMMTGCTAPGAGTTGNSKTDIPASQGNGQGTEEPVQMSWLGSQTTAEVDDDAEVVKMIEERFNIDLKGFYVDPNNFQDNLDVKFAGGEMPDVMVVGSPAALATYIDGGIIGEIPIEVIREKAPNYAKTADQYDDGSLWTTMIYKGKNYGVSNPMSQIPMAMFWRKDWLDKLNLEIPETLEEYEKVLTAFVEEDPDGNGRKDTAGIAERAFGGVFGAFGLRCVTGTGTSSGFLVDEMQLGEDNIPFFPYIRPEAKEALTVLHDWYEKGIIDKEFITGENHGGYAALSHSFMNGHIGLTSAQPYHYFQYSNDINNEENWGVCLKELLEVNQEADVVPGPAPVGPDGKSGTEAWGMVGHLTCLTTKAADDPRKVEAFLAMLDAYYMDMDYAELVNYGLEGKHFTKGEHGRKRIMDGIELRKEGILQVDFGNTVLYAENLASEKTQYGKDITGNGYYRFNAPPVEEFSDVIAALDTLTEQAYFAMITGEKPIEYFDTFVEEFKKAGGETAEKAVQAAYAEKLAARK